MTPHTSPSTKDREPWVGRCGGAWVLVAAFLALTLGVIADPGNPIIAMLAFGAWTVFLVRVVIELLGKLFRVPKGQPNPARRERVVAFTASVQAGIKAAREGQYDLAVEWFEVAENCSPGRLEVALSIADAMRRAGRLDEARSRLEDSLVFHAGAPSLHLAVARYSCLAGDEDRAMEELELAGAIEPDCWATALNEPDLLNLSCWIARRVRG